MEKSQNGYKKCDVKCVVSAVEFMFYISSNEENTDVELRAKFTKKIIIIKSHIVFLMKYLKVIIVGLVASLVIVSGVMSWSKLSFYSDQTELLFIFPFVCILNSKMIRSRALKHVDVLHRTSLELYYMS